MDRIVTIPYLAEAVTAIVLRRPELAVDRPGQLVKEDSTYRRIFNPKIPLSVYLECAHLLRKVDGSRKGMLYELRLYAAMYASSLHTGQVHPSITDIAQAGFSHIDDDVIRRSIEAVKECYRDAPSKQRVTRKRGRSLLAISTLREISRRVDERLIADLESKSPHSGGEPEK